VRQITINKNRGLALFFVDLLFVGVGMKLVVDIAEAFVGYVGVNLSGGDITVAKEFLD